jgi:hypothetical protein
MTCSYCGQPRHNKKGCALKKAGLQPLGNMPSASVEPTEEAPTAEEQPFQYDRNMYGEAPMAQVLA